MSAWVKRDQFETRSIQNKRGRIFRPSRFRGRTKTRYPSPFLSFFSKNLYGRGLHTLIIVRHFKVFTGTLYCRRTSSRLHRQALFSEPNAFFAAKHFVFFICPILLKLGMEENDPSTKGRTKKSKMFSGINESKQRQVTPTNATLLGWTKSFLFRLWFWIFVFF